MATPPAHTSEELDRVVAVWTRVVQTQEHFNDICMRVRTLYATVIAAIVASYGVLIEHSKQHIALNQLQVDAIGPMALAAALAAYLFYFMDRYWYHALLLGAVAQGAEIEAKWAGVIPEIQLGKKITEKSPVSLQGRPIAYMFCRLFVSDPRLKANKKLHSDAKIEIFYKPVARLMLLAFVLVVLFGGVRYGGKSLFQLVVDAAFGA